MITDPPQAEHAVPTEAGRANHSHARLARVAFALMKNQTDYEPRIPSAQTLNPTRAGI